MKKYMKKPVVIEAEQLTEETHTVDELYHHRAILFATICNLFPDRAGKSKLHADGTMYDGMFLAWVETPEGNYSYHCEMDEWSAFRITEYANAPEWDGHKPDDVGRLLSLSANYNQFAEQ